jgi:hypothetical protein
MYTFVRALPTKQLLVGQLPIALVSLIIAELFYKFHSFTLETIAFLATWFLLDGLFTAVLGLETRWRNRNEHR